MCRAVGPEVTNDPLPEPPALLQQNTLLPILNILMCILMCGFLISFHIYYCGKRVGGNERFRGHGLRIRYYDLNCSRI